MLGFIKKWFFTAFLSTLTSINLLSCISMNNQECKVRPQIVNVNGDDPVFFPFSIKKSKCSGSCNNISNPYAKICVPDVVKSLNFKVFNLMSRTNETRHIEWHETCKWEYGLDASVCNTRQRWRNDDKCRCEGKKLIYKGVCNKGSIWNPGNCEYECHKSRDTGEYLDYENCKYKLAEECTENIDEVKIAGMVLFENGNECVCSYTICVVLAVIALTISIGIGAYFGYKYKNRNKETGGTESFNYQTTLPY